MYSVRRGEKYKSRITEGVIHTLTDRSTERGRERDGERVRDGEREERSESV